ncbi:nucleotide exchange factor GrpE [Ktedonospora formicarum]|uniref:Protein GrpE n=1 Tax=Ktedonospora formicarum TaxID=2778364 RepID=A0A8J3HUN7_9CHLR|nr:nucleotide exchange factor GrpE [Ktedonospora formicarum]GHO44084.1 protein GrpE [Ktedonospora formicarum]
MEDSQEKMAEQNTQPTNEQRDADARIAELETQLEQARKEAAENWNKYLRERAEWDNFRKRQERQLEQRVASHKKALFHKLLDVMDNVERALVYQETMDKANLQQTLRMFHWQMNEVLRGEGLNIVPTVGETFNPYVHEAIEAVESTDQPEGTILEEMRKGYTFGEETLRPAHVKVSVPVGKNGESDTK